MTYFMDGPSLTFHLRVLLRTLLPHPDYSSHMCSFAYCFPTLINLPSLAALLTIFPPVLQLLCVHLCSAVAYSDFSFLLCCFAYYYSHYSTRGLVRLLPSYPDYSLIMCSLACYFTTLISPR